MGNDPELAARREQDAAYLTYLTGLQSGDLVMHAKEMIESREKFARMAKEYDREIRMCDLAAFSNGWYDQYRNEVPFKGGIFD